MTDNTIVKRIGQKRQSVVDKALHRTLKHWTTWNLLKYGDIKLTNCLFFVFSLFCQFLWIVHFWLSLRYSLTFICQFLWIVHFWLSLRYSLTFIFQFLWIVHFWLSIRCSLTFIYILQGILHTLPTSLKC